MRLRRSIVAVSIVAATLVGLTGAPAQSANALCPQICLTGGILGLGATRVNVQGWESRTYHFSWTALDLTELPPVAEALQITIYIDGTQSNGVFTGTGGYAEITNDYYGYQYVDDVRVTATALTVTASSFTNDDEQFQLQATTLGGGEATFTTTYDHDWDYCIEC